MPQTYIRTCPGVMGCSGCFSPVIELCMRIMASRPLREPGESLAGLAGRHRFQQWSKLRTVCTARERHPQRHVERSPLLARGRANRVGDRGKVITAGGGGLCRSREVAFAGLLDNLLLGRLELRQIAEYNIDPWAHILRKNQVGQHSR